MIELPDYLIKILGDETGNDELKNKLHYIKSLIEANKTLNDIKLSFTEKEIKIFKELCIKILHENLDYGCKTKKSLNLSLRKMYIQCLL